jgi:anti-sigma factor RsiW
MTAHLTPETLNALVDAELTPQQLAEANAHLSTCPACTTQALSTSLLKSATARAGHRFTVSAHLEQSLTRIANELPAPAATKSRSYAVPLAWATAAMFLILAGSGALIQHNRQATAQQTALLTEAVDQHIATLASPAPPEVLSTDRHTVKPWFQGRIPFAFNLPDGLPEDTHLEGANLTYVHNQPTAQLLYTIGKHRVSVLLWQRLPDSPAVQPRDYAGFHTRAFATPTLEAVAVSDIDPARLADLVARLERAQ